MGTRAWRLALAVAAAQPLLAPAVGAAQQAAGDATAEVPLLPTPRQLRAHEARLLARDLERTLAGWPGVEQARVHIALPNPAEDALDAAGAAPGASVSLLVARGSDVQRTTAAQLVAGAVAGLEPDSVRVVVTQVSAPAPTTATPELARLGPFAVARESEPGLRWTLAIALLLLAGLALALMLTLRRARRSEGAD